MNNIIELLAGVTIFDEQLGLLFHCRPVETLCHNPVLSGRSPIWVSQMPQCTCSMICLASLGDMHLQYGSENDHLYKTSLIKAYLDAWAFILTAAFLSSGKDPFFK